MRAFGVHKNTVRGWLKKGLPKIDNSRPILIHGADLRDFLDGRRKAARRHCAAGTMYCLKCRAARPPALDMVEYLPLSDTSGNLRALCSSCGTLMNRRVRRADVLKVMPSIAVQFEHPARHIGDGDESSLQCDSGRDGDDDG